MNILISGGHLSPALAFIDHLKSKNSKMKIIFVGRKYSQLVNKKLALEKTELTKRDIAFINFFAPKIDDPYSIKILFIIPELVEAFFNALSIINQTKPKLFLSFGGYLATPLALACFIKKIPIITHEQTTAAGFSNQFIALMAKKIAISSIDSKKYFPAHKIIVTGNPIRPELLRQNFPRPQWIKSNFSLPILLIIGGSQGSSSINAIIKKILPILTKKWLVIHVCDKASKQKNYYPRKWLSIQELGWAYQQAHLAISRAGANTIQELMINQLPTIFIPLPQTHRDEQIKNAYKAVVLGAGMVLEQSDLTPQNLITCLINLEKEHDQMKKKLATLKINAAGAANLLKLINDLIDS